jgi:hypothetical protein
VLLEIRVELENGILELDIKLLGEGFASSKLGQLL